MVSEIGHASEEDTFGRPEVLKLFSCSTQLSMKFSLLINMKMPTIVGIFIFINREFSCSAMFSKKEFAIVSNFRFIIRKNFMLSCVEHEKSFINLRACFYQLSEFVTSCLLSCRPDPFW